MSILLVPDATSAGLRIRTHRPWDPPRDGLKAWGSRGGIEVLDSFSPRYRAKGFRGALRSWLQAVLLVAGGAVSVANAAGPVQHAPCPTHSVTPEVRDRCGSDADIKEGITFGILPIGGPSESLQAWRPMLDDMSRSLHESVRSISVSTYEGLAQAMEHEPVDVAFLSGRLALDAVLHDHMQVIAQLTRTDGSRGYRSVLIVPTNSPIRSIADLVARPGHWRYARAEKLSLSGYMMPETQLFASRGLNSDTFFAHVTVDNHQNNALAVANRESDVASNNTADLERFKERFPYQYSRLRVLWTSTLIPHAVIVVRRDLSAQRRRRIEQFVTGYAKPGKRQATELTNLKRIHDISGFASADNRALIPFAEMTYTMERRRALAAQWVDDAARKKRLKQIENEHRTLLQALTAIANDSNAAPVH